MKRLASEIISELETRIARLEKQATSSSRASSSRSSSRRASSRYADPFLAELQSDIDDGMHMANEFQAGRNPDGQGWAEETQKDYNSPPAPKNQADCYTEDNLEGLGKPGDGVTCYRLHHEYGKANSGKPGSPARKKYNQKYRENFMDSPSIQRKTCPKPGGGRGPCNRG